MKHHCESQTFLFHSWLKDVKKTGWIFLIKYGLEKGLVTFTMKNNHYLTVATELKELKLEICNFLFKKVLIQVNEANVEKMHQD